MKRKWLIGIGIVAVLIAGVAVTSWLTVPPADLAVVKDFYEALSLPYEGETDPNEDVGDVAPRIDVGRAYATFSPDLQRKLDLEEFKDRATRHASIVYETNRYWSNDLENGTATVEGRFTREGDVEVASGLFWLANENDTWKIVAFRIEDELGSFTGGTIPGSE